MSALAAVRIGSALRFIERDFRPLAANAKIWPGAALVCLTAGGNAGYYAQAAGAVTGQVCGGVATGKGGTTLTGGGFATSTVPYLAGTGAIDNTGGANGALYAEIAYDNPFHIRLFRNDTTTPVTVANRGSSCYWLDDQTVTGTAGGNSAVGTVYDVTAEGVWVKLGGGPV